MHLWQRGAGAHQRLPGSKLRSILEQFEQDHWKGITITNSIFTYEFTPPDRYQFYTGPTANVTRQVGAETFLYDRAADKWSVLANYSGEDLGASQLTNPKRMVAAGGSLPLVGVTSGQPCEHSSVSPDEPRMPMVA